MKTAQKNHFTEKMDGINEFIYKAKASSPMTEKEYRKCNLIIHSASAVAGLGCAGVAQIPCADNVFLAPLQLTMAISLGKIFGISLTKSTAESAVASASGYFIGRTATQLAWGWIPVAGNAINATTAAALTELLGWALVASFSNEAAKRTFRGCSNF